MLRQCLAGLRVLDLSQYLPGPYGAQILADLGAEVVKIEPPGGDPMRAVGPTDADGVSAFYKVVNAGKTVVRLDLKTRTGRETFAGLVRGADALIESFRPGVLAGLGFDRDRLGALNPGLVHTALSGFGQTGPYAGRAGHDINYMALAGGLGASGTAERPVAAYPPTADFAGGMQAALVTLAGLLKRGQSGAGGFFDVSLSETVLAWQAVSLTGAIRPGFGAARAEGLLSGGAACYRVYRTADRRFVTLGALEAKFWAAFCDAVGRADWIERQTEPLPQTKLIAEVAALFAGQALRHWEDLLAPVDCCFESVLDLDRVPDHGQIAARGLVRRSAGPAPLVEVLFPAFLDGAPPSARAPVREAPALEILSVWSGR